MRVRIYDSLESPEPMRRINAPLVVSLFLCLSLLAAGCASEDAAATAAARNGANGSRGGGAGGAVPVTVAPVVRKSVPIEIGVIGAAEPFSSVAIRSQITGQLNTVTFTEGDDVKAGQVL